MTKISPSHSPHSDELMELGEQKKPFSTTQAAAKWSGEKPGSAFTAAMESEAESIAGEGAKDNDDGAQKVSKKKSQTKGSWAKGGDFSRSTVNTVTGVSVGRDSGEISSK